MALDYQTLRGLYQRYQGRDLPQSELQYLGGENGPWKNMSPEQFVREVIMPSQEYASATGKRASAIYQPTLDAYREQAGANIAASEAEYTDLADRIRKEAKSAGTGLTEKMNRYGLLRSGATAAGLGDIAQNEQKAINQADVQRQIARSGINMNVADFESKIKQAIADETVNTRKQDLADIQGQGEYGLQRETQKLSNELAKFKSVEDLYSNPYVVGGLPDDILKQFLESIGYTVTA